MLLLVKTSISAKTRQIKLRQIITNIGKLQNTVALKSKDVYCEIVTDNVGHFDVINDIVYHFTIFLMNNTFYAWLYFEKKS